MTLANFYKMMDYRKEREPLGSMVVKLKYKYSWEKKWEMSNELFIFDGDDFIWENDWNEGQEDVEVLGYVFIDDINIENNLEG